MSASCIFGFFWFVAIHMTQIWVNLHLSHIDPIHGQSFPIHVFWELNHISQITEILFCPFECFFSRFNLHFFLCSFVLGIKNYVHKFHSGEWHQQKWYRHTIIDSSTYASVHCFFCALFLFSSQSFICLSTSLQKHHACKTDYMLFVRMYIQGFQVLVF
jgi:hypothetical protein